MKCTNIQKKAATNPSFIVLTKRQFIRCPNHTTYKKVITQNTSAVGARHSPLDIFPPDIFLGICTRKRWMGGNVLGFQFWEGKCPRGNLSGEPVQGEKFYIFSSSGCCSATTGHQWDEDRVTTVTQAALRLTSMRLALVILLHTSQAIYCKLLSFIC